jgi:hypothetical protein
VENVESDAIAGDGVFDGACSFDGFRTKTESALGNFVNVDFAVGLNIWEFPEMRVDDAGRSLANEVARVSLDDESEKTSRRGGSAAGNIWEQVDDAFAMREAIGYERAVGTARLFGCADESPQFHEGLIEMGTGGKAFVCTRWGERPREPTVGHGYRGCGSRGRLPHRSDQFFRKLPKFDIGLFFARIAFNAKEASQNTNDVAIKYRSWLIKCDAADCARRVTSDSR